MPRLLVVHGNNDTTGAVRAVQGIATGMGWRPVSEPVTVTGEVEKATLEACWELGALAPAILAESL